LHDGRVLLGLDFAMNQFEGNALGVVAWRCWVVVGFDLVGLLKL